MGVLEYVRKLLLECPLLSGEVISIGFFDERIGGVAVYEVGGKSVVREYTDGGRLVEESAKIVFSHTGGLGNDAEIAAARKADGICRWFGLLSAFAPLDKNEVFSVECSVSGVSGDVGGQKRELLCKVRYFERNGEN